MIRKEGTSEGVEERMDSGFRFRCQESGFR